MLSNLPKNWFWGCIGLSVACLSIGCRTGQSVSDQRFQGLSTDLSASISHAGITQPSGNPVVDVLVGPNAVETYIDYGLRQNSEIQEARLRIETMANRVPQAASLADPMLGATVFPSPVQTAAGEQEFALSLNQKLPARGKLSSRSAMAEEEVNVARAQLAEIELRVVEQIKIAYYELYFIQQAIKITEEDRDRLKMIEGVVEQVYQVKNTVTQQDILQVQVALSQIDAELVQFRQQKKSTQAKLAKLLHVSPETELAAIDQLPPSGSSESLEQLYEIAIQSNPELHAQLSAIKRDRHAVDLAQLENRPDMTVGFNWVATSSEGISPVANGNDALMLTLGVNLPVYRKRIDAGVREAETRALADAKKYDRIRDETMEGIADVFAKTQSIQETLDLFQSEIIPKQKLSLEQSIEDYSVGKVDFLQMIENWRKLLRFHIQERRLESELYQSNASLSRELGRFSLQNESLESVSMVKANSSEGVN